MIRKWIESFPKHNRLNQGNKEKHFQIGNEGTLYSEWVMWFGLYVWVWILLSLWTWRIRSKGNSCNLLSTTEVHPRGSFPSDRSTRTQIKYNELTTTRGILWLQNLHYFMRGFDSRHFQNFWEAAGLERGPLSLVRTTEELLEGKVAAPV
jgi:hypothetical protein